MAKVLTRSATVATQYICNLFYSLYTTPLETECQKKAQQSDESSAMHLGLKGYISFIFIIQFFN